MVIFDKPLKQVSILSKVVYVQVVYVQASWK